MKPVLALFLFTACAPEVDMSLVVDPPEHATEVEALIRERYGCGKATVYWYGPSAYKCDNGMGFVSPVSGSCVGGTSWDDIIVVGMFSLDQRLDTTALVHEYRHFADDPNRDGGHTRADWWGDYNHDKPGGQVETVRAEVRALLGSPANASLAGRRGPIPTASE